MLFLTIHYIVFSAGRTFIDLSARKSRGSCDLARVHSDEADDSTKGQSDFFSDLFSFFLFNQHDYE